MCKTHKRSETLERREVDENNKNRDIDSKRRGQFVYKEENCHGGRTRLVFVIGKCSFV